MVPQASEARGSTGRMHLSRSAHDQVEADGGGGTNDPRDRCADRTSDVERGAALHPRGRAGPTSAAGDYREEAMSENGKVTLWILSGRARTAIAFTWTARTPCVSRGHTRRWRTPST